MSKTQSYDIPVDGRNPADITETQNPGVFGWRFAQAAASNVSKQASWIGHFFLGRDLGHPEAKYVYMNCIVRDIVMYSWGW